MSKKDGGLAYPASRSMWRDESRGMSLRDWYAGMALQGILAAQIYGFNDRPVNGPFVDMAVELADAMIKEREDGRTE